MKQVSLRDSLLVDLEEYAREQSESPEQILDKLVSQFLYQMALKKMQAETEAFQQMHTDLMAEHVGEYVAIHNRRLIDHDVDLAALRKRIRQKFGRMAILIRQVTENREVPVFTFRSPKRVVSSHEMLP